MRKTPITPLKNPSFCAYPFVQLSTVPAGFYRPCCYYLTMLKNSKGRNLSVTENSLEEVWNSEMIRGIRKKMIRGEKVFECRQCYQEETNGRNSIRQRSLKDWGDHEGLAKAIIEAERNDYYLSTGPYFLEIKPGNLCNLKCRMCNQFDSSSVASELKILAKKYSHLIAVSDSRLFDKSALEVDFSLEQMPNWSEIPHFWQSVSLAIPYLETLSFAGGEPTLLPEVHSLLRQCVESGHSKKIHVFLSSNFTYINKELVELSTQFNPFEFIASIDGVGPVQEYIRFPSKWSVVAENFIKVKEHLHQDRVKLLVNLTLQMYNILTFTEVLDWIEQLALEQPYFHQHPYYLNILFEPKFLTIDILPLSLRDLAIEKIEGYLQRSRLIHSVLGLQDRLHLILHRLRRPLPVDYEENLQKFWAYTLLLDNHRKQKLEQVDPILFAGVLREMERMGVGEIDFQLKGEHLAEGIINICSDRL